MKGTTLAALASAAAAILVGTASFTSPDCGKVIAEALAVAELSLPDGFGLVTQAVCAEVANHGETHYSLAVVGVLAAAWGLHFVKHR